MRRAVALPSLPGCRPGEGSEVLCQPSQATNAAVTQTTLLPATALWPLRTGSPSGHRQAVQTVQAWERPWGLVLAPASEPGEAAQPLGGSVCLCVKWAHTLQGGREEVRGQGTRRRRETFLSSPESSGVRLCPSSATSSCGPWVGHRCPRASGLLDRDITRPHHAGLLGGCAGQTGGARSSCAGQREAF